MRLIYGELDEKFVKAIDEQEVKHLQPLDTYKFNRHPFLKGNLKYDKNGLPIVFKTSPDSLLNLTSIIVDAFPLPSIFTWTNIDVCKWIREYGYPHYQNTFRVNLIDGHKLLLLRASALSAMNIKKFEDIKHIAYGIRCLFHFEMTKFMRSISLAPEYHYELYKLFRVKTGRKYEETRRTDLWRRLQMIRPKSKYYSHWELLERWLALEDADQKIIVGGSHRYCLYRCKMPQPEDRKQHQVAHQRFGPCNCMPPCECYWRDGATDLPKVLSCLKDYPIDSSFKEQCPRCMLPCICNWKSDKFVAPSVLTCLKEALPNKYGTLFGGRHVSPFMGSNYPIDDDGWDYI